MLVQGKSSSVEVCLHVGEGKTCEVAVDRKVDEQSEALLLS